ncbi:hypothetical protein TNCV_4464991 [Trichonephila clavipes]|nr:hypothetical protein TNCV_4464991 [Trichonephila clavipes]
MRFRKAQSMEWNDIVFTDESRFGCNIMTIGSNYFLACLFFRSIPNRKCVVHACTTTGEYTGRCYTRSTLEICGNRMVTAVPKDDKPF